MATSGAVDWLCLGCGTYITATARQLVEAGWYIVYEPLAWAECLACQQQKEEKNDE